MEIKVSQVRVSLLCNMTSGLLGPARRLQSSTDGRGRQENTKFVVRKDDHLILILVRFLEEVLEEGAEHRRCDRVAPPDPVWRRIRRPKASKVRSDVLDGASGAAGDASYLMIGK